jgi:glycine/D-amino acid oxidase-like deaminating enzyme
VATLQQQALKHGSTIIDEHVLKSVESSKGTVVATFENKRIGQASTEIKISCKKLIVAPGAWLTPLADRLFNLKLHTRVLQMGYYYFNTRGADQKLYDLSRFPVFINYGPKNSIHIYGTPAYEYPSLLKVGAHGDNFKSHQVTADTRSFSALPELCSYVQNRVRLHFRNADWSTIVHSETCLYTMTRNEEFLLDTVPGNPDVILAGGGSGHAFKHGSAIGSILADLALNNSADEWAIPQFQVPYHLENSSKL